MKNKIDYVKYIKYKMSLNMFNPDNKEDYDIVPMDFIIEIPKLMDLEDLVELKINENIKDDVEVMDLTKKLEETSI